MSDNAASNVLPFKSKAVLSRGCGISRTLEPREAQSLSALICYVAYELKSEEAEILEITQRVFGVCDLKYLPARDLETVMKFLIGLTESSAATEN